MQLRSQCGGTGSALEVDCSASWKHVFSQGHLLLHGIKAWYERLKDRASVPTTSLHSWVLGSQLGPVVQTSLPGLCACLTAGWL